MTSVFEQDGGSSTAPEVRLTRAEAAAFLAEMGVRLKPATLARLWSTGGNGPPCRHIRSKPYYPLEMLRQWGLAQIGEVRSGAPAAAQPRRRAGS